MNGYGIFLWKDGRVYKGYYKEDKKHDFGMYYKPDGKCYEGHWINGLHQSLGRYTKKEGVVKLGIWNSNNLEEEYDCSTDFYLMKNQEIEELIYITNQKVDETVLNLRSCFSIFLPNSSLEDFIE